MSVVREDVWSREDSAEVILERRVAYRTTSQRKRQYLEGCKGSHNLGFHRRLLLLQHFQFRIQLPGRDIILVHPSAAFRL
jgi:hypothetical protein